MPAETPPAADGGLPGPLPWHVFIGHLGATWIGDANGEKVLVHPSSAAPFVAWINAQSALLAEKDAEYAKLARELAAADAEIDNLSVTIPAMQLGTAILEDQLATATERLASAEAAVNGILDAVTNEIDLSKRSPMFVRAIKGLRAWLTFKDGEKQP